MWDLPLLASPRHITDTGLPKTTCPAYTVNAYNMNGESEMPTRYEKDATKYKIKAVTWVGINVMESIEYAVKKLQVPLLMLLGHDNCGVMEYAQASYPEVKGNFQTILKCVYPAIDIDKKSKENDTFLYSESTKL